MRFRSLIVLMGALAACSANSPPPPGAAIAPDPRCMGDDPRNPCSIYRLSLIELIARPEIYDGRRVLVKGFASLEFEDNGLYVSREDATVPIRKNGVWIDPPPATAEGSQLFLWNRRYVMVEGQFSAVDTGHMGLWSGSISDISRYRAISGGAGRPDEERDPSITSPD